MYNILKFVCFQIQNIKIISFFSFFGIIVNVHYIFKKLLKDTSETVDCPPLPLTSTKKNEEEERENKGGIGQINLGHFLCIFYHSFLPHPKLFCVVFFHPFHMDAFYLPKKNFHH